MRVSDQHLNPASVLRLRPERLNVAAVMVKDTIIKLKRMERSLRNLPSASTVKD